MPRTSSSRMISSSSPSSLISVPEYLPNRMLSPAFTSSGNTLPSSFDLPLPTEITSPCCGFSFAESGMMMPPRMLSPSSMRRTRIQSCSDVNNVVAIALHLLVSNSCCDFGERGLRPRVVVRDEFRQEPRLNLPQRSLGENRQPPRFREPHLSQAHRFRPISTQASRLLKIVSSKPHVKSPM